MREECLKIGLILILGGATLAFLTLLFGCTRTYNVYIIGTNDVTIEVTASVPKQIEASLEGHLQGLPR